MAEPVKRLHYFDKQFLRETDFSAEQEYHVRMRRLHNRLLHTWGIGEGLKLSFAAGASRVAIDEGTAIDAQGHEIVLAVKTEKEVPFIDATLFVTISYAEEETDPSAETGAPGKTRITESPIIEVSQNPPGDPGQKLILGRVTVDHDGKVTGTDEGEAPNQRRAAGVVAGDLAVRSLSLTDPNVVPMQWPRLRLGAAGRADVEGNLRVAGTAATTGGLTVGGATELIGDARARGKLRVDGAGSFGANVGIGTISPNRDLTIQKGGTAAGVYENVKNDTHEILVGVDAAAIVSAMTASDLQLRTNDATRMTIKANTGNVGIGIADPGFRLDVGERARIRMGASASAGIWFFQGNPPKDHGFVGLANDNQIGFFGNDGASWGLVMDTASGNVSIGGVVRAAKFSSPVGLQVDGNIIAHNVIATKVGYVTDLFVNKLDDPLEQGDVVVVGKNQTSLYYRDQKDVPVPEVDLTQRAYDARLCGIVHEVFAEQKIASADEDSRSKAKKTRAGRVDPKRSEAIIEPLTGERLATLDRTKVGSEQVGSMVTLGAYACCKVDADIAPIEVGDLLTTSPTKGHAQKVLDPSKAVGAILGKALGALKKGKGKIPVMVLLQ